MTTTTPANAVAVRDESTTTLGFLQAAVTTFEGVQKLAELMARMGTMPAHLQGKPADCFRVVVQAAKWRMDPFAVAECTSLVHGRMCYEGKLVAAVLTAMNAIEGRLHYEISGKGQDASIVITGTARGSKPQSLSGTVKEWRTYGKDKNGNRIDNAWDKIPEDMLVYRGTRQWARRYAPEAVLGVYTPDEAEEIREVEATVHDAVPAPKAATRRVIKEAAPARGDAADAGTAAPAAVEQPAETTPAAGGEGALEGGAQASAPAAGERPAAETAPATEQAPTQKTISCAACQTALTVLWKRDKARAQTLMDAWKIKQVSELASVTDEARADFIAQVEKTLSELPAGGAK